MFSCFSFFQDAEQRLIMRISKSLQRVLDCIWILLLIAIMYALKIPCLFKMVFHIDCPGCGITRAYISLLCLDIRKAFMFNPMFWSVPVVFILYLFDDHPSVHKGLKTFLLSTIYLGFLILWLYRVVVL